MVREYDITACDLDGDHEDPVYPCADCGDAPVGVKGDRCAECAAAAGDLEADTDA